MSDGGDAVFVVRWTEAGVEHTGLFTPSKLIARDGSKIDGRTIKRILPTCLTINRAGTIGFEAVAGNANQIAVFVGNNPEPPCPKEASPTISFADDNQVISQGATIAASDQTHMAMNATDRNGCGVFQVTVFRPIIKGIRAPTYCPDGPAIAGEARRSKQTPVCRSTM